MHFEIQSIFLYVLICEQYIYLPVFGKETKKKHKFLSKYVSYTVLQNTFITLLRFYQLKPKLMQLIGTNRKTECVKRRVI